MRPCSGGYWIHDSCHLQKVRSTHWGLRQFLRLCARFLGVAGYFSPSISKLLIINWPPTTKAKYRLGFWIWNICLSISQTPDLVLGFHCQKASLWFFSYTLMWMYQAPLLVMSAPSWHLSLLYPPKHRTKDLFLLGLLCCLWEVYYKLPFLLEDSGYSPDTEALNN
jgi:Zn-dependent protease with chaperone function